MKSNLVGRLREKAVLKEISDSDGSQFLALTGRRRVGKTYLIKSYFNDKIDFDFSGILNASQHDQLQNFQFALTHHFKQYKKSNVVLNWLSAFKHLSLLLQKTKKKRKQVVFIDELPWLDTHKSNFLAALDWFWNSWAVDQNIVLIVCGSSTSWIINKLINNKGGLHNRITKRIHLEPFTLGETEDFLKQRGIALSRYQLLQTYMAFGGIPHYLKEIRKGESAMQAIDRVCFKKSGLLVNEFDNLYKALFNNYQTHIKIIFALSAKLKGLTRGEILAITKLSDGGTFTSILEELEWCSFITSQPSFGKVKKEILYRLTDEFSLFYLKFMYKKRNVNWQQLSSGNTWKSWSGYAFENICIKHVSQLKSAMGISGVYTEESGFIYKGTKTKKGAQIDLVIDRNDGIINLCEAKFYNKEFSISKSYAGELKEKKDIFERVSATNKTVFLSMITTYGLNSNTHSNGLIQQEMDMNDLFAD